MRRAIVHSVAGLLLLGSVHAAPKEDCEQSKDPQTVIAACTQVLREQVGNAVAYNKRGQSHIELGDYDRALADFNKALDLNPMYADAYVGRGRSRPNGEERRAVVDFDKAIELDPANALAYFYRSQMYSVSRPDYRQRAFADLSKTIELDPGFALAYVARGLLYAANGQRLRAKTDFAKVVGVDAVRTELIRSLYPSLVDELEEEGRTNPR